MKTRLVIAAICAAALLPIASPARAADPAKAASIDRDARAALERLYATTPAARSMGAKAVAVLVFPSVTKAGLMVGGQYGEGALIRGGKTVAYYSTAGVSYGLQAGAQTFGYAMIFMNAGALKSLESNQGLEVGVGPSVVVVDEGMAKSTTTKTLDKDIYAFIFSQKGLMAGLGLQGNKITRISP
jgi:lipid-binding SYLF domain-containing protein